MQYCGVSGRQLQFRELLWEWIHIVERTTRLWTDNDDSAWLYNERASISIFAGAVWRAGGIAFEEFSTEKYLDVSASNAQRQIVSGRGDIFFQIGKKDFIAEAKQCRAPAGPRSNPSRIVGIAMSDAVRDAGLCKLYFSYRPLALVFAAPQIIQSQIDNADVLLNQWLQAVHTVQHHSLAWVFPQAARKKRKKNHYYPGVALLISEVIP